VDFAASEESATGSAEQEMTVSEQDKAQAVERAARLLGCTDQASWQALRSLWDEAYDKGRLDALDELQDRFCVCMK
jgi:DNA primase